MTEAQSLVETENTGTELTGLGGLPEDIQRKILDYTKQIQESSSLSVAKIRLDDKTYIFPDGTELSSFSGIIVAVRHANIYYADEYVEGVVSPSRCFAIGDVPCASLKPHPSVVDPIHGSCANCPNFQWGSGARKKGKACSEYTLLAVFVPSMGNDLFYLEEKKSNSRAIDTYMHNTARRFGSPIAVMTQFKIGERTKWEQTFAATSPVARELISNLAERIDEGMDMITAKVTSTYRAPTTTDEDDETEDRPPTR